MKNKRMHTIFTQVELGVRISISNLFEMINITTAMYRIYDYILCTSYQRLLGIQ